MGNSSCDVQASSMTSTASRLHRMRSGSGIIGSPRWVVSSHPCHSCKPRRPVGVPLGPLLRSRCHEEAGDCLKYCLRAVARAEQRHSVATNHLSSIRCNDTFETQNRYRLLAFSAYFAWYLAWRKPRYEVSELRQL